MTEYDPMWDLVPETWLALDESERLALVREYHEDIAAEAPGAIVHAVFHVIVENQLASGEATVRTTLSRLIGEGLDRHDAIHAIGSVLAEHTYDLLRNGPLEENVKDAYFAGLEHLTADRWRETD